MSFFPSNSSMMLINNNSNNTNNVYTSYYTISVSIEFLQQEIRNHLLIYYPKLSSIIIQDILYNAELIARQFYTRLMDDRIYFHNEDTIPDSMILSTAQQFHENLLRNINELTLLSSSKLLENIHSSAPVLLHSISSIVPQTDDHIELLKRMKLNQDSNSNTLPITNKEYSKYPLLNPFEEKFPNTLSKSYNDRYSMVSNPNLKPPLLSSTPNPLLSQPNTTNLISTTTAITTIYNPHHTSSSTNNNNSNNNNRRTNLTEYQKNILREWFIQHIDHPYPTEYEREMLAQQILTTNERVANWFINARAREWDKMRCSE